MATSVEKVDWTVQNIMWKEMQYPSSLDIDSANLLHGSRDQTRPATAALQAEVFAALCAGVYNQNHNLKMKSCMWCVLGAGRGRGDISASSLLE